MEQDAFPSDPAMSSRDVLSSNQRRAGLTWTPLKGVVSILGVFVLWYATTPFVYRGLLDLTLNTSIYWWLLGWALTTAVVGGVLEGLIAGCGYRRWGAAAWVPTGLVAIVPFAFVTGHWAADEPAWTRTFGQLLTATVFWLAMCVCQYLLARKIAVWWQRTPCPVPGLVEARN